MSDYWPLIPLVICAGLFLALSLCWASKGADEATEAWKHRQGGRGIR